MVFYLLTGVSLFKFMGDVSLHFYTHFSDVGYWFIRGSLDQGQAFLYNRVPMGRHADLSKRVHCCDLEVEAWIFRNCVAQL